MPDNGTSLYSVSEPIGNTPAEKFIETIMAGWAEFDNGVRKQRSTDGMSQKINQGIWPWKTPPGYKCGHYKKQGLKKLQPDQPDEATFPIIQRGLQEYARYGHTPTDLAILLDKWGLGIARGKPTDNKFVFRILEHNLKFYAGIIFNPWTGKEVKGLHKPMITMDEYEQICFIRSGKVKRIKKQLYNPDFPLRTTVSCGSCRKLLTGSASRTKKPIPSNNSLVYCWAR